ncbi:unnamed protein product [Boreogadus saida]
MSLAEGVKDDVSLARLAEDQTASQLQILMREVHVAANLVISCGNQMLSICVDWPLAQKHRWPSWHDHAKISQVARFNKNQPRRANRGLHGCPLQKASQARAICTWPSWHGHGLWPGLDVGSGHRLGTEDSKCPRGNNDHPNP